jgi:uncharacterized protein (DUF885 family)
MPRLLTFLAVLALTASNPLAQSADPAAQLHQLFDEHWAFTLEQNPLFATRVGEHRYNHLLPSVSVEDARHRQEHARNILARLESIDRGALSAQDRLNYDIFARQLRDGIREAEFESYYMPITSRGGFHISFPELGQQVPMANVRDYENYIARLRAFRAYADQHIDLMREGVSRGFTLPAVVMEGYDAAIIPHIVADPTESLLWRPFERFPEAISAAERQRLAAAGRAAIAESVVPGYEAFLAFMRDEYVPASRESIAVAEIPRGADYYAHRVRLFTTLDDMTPERVHEIGISEVARIRAEMQEVIDGVGFEGSFDEFVEFLRTDDRFYVDTPEELMRHVAEAGKRADGEMPRLFKTLPRMPWGLREVPAFIAPRTTTAYYQRPAGDGTEAGFYYVNTYNLRSRPLYEIEALTLHEAIPGHHHQIALQQEIEGMPTFRRFAGFTAFTEGWGLYAERLGLEMGFYQDPYSNFGRLTYEMWRALRLVVDTGMHALGWERQQAIDFMAANSALTLHNITTEVDRYISWPGQALAYKIGELKIRELRAGAEQALGEHFDVREFHDVVLLSGAVPLSVLEANVERWVAQERVRLSAR